MQRVPCLQGMPHEHEERVEPEVRSGGADERRQVHGREPRVHHRQRHLRGDRSRQLAVGHSLPLAAVVLVIHTCARSIVSRSITCASARRRRTLSWKLRVPACVCARATVCGGSSRQFAVRFDSAPRTGVPAIRAHADSLQTWYLKPSTVYSRSHCAALRGAELAAE